MLLYVWAGAHPQALEAGGGIRPVDIAIGDGKNVSVNVTALCVPFSRKGSSPQAA